MPEPCNPTVTAAELAQFDLFKDDEPEALEWLAQRFEARCFAAGEQFVDAGGFARELMVVLEGEFHFVRDDNPHGGVFIRLPGEAGGLLPFSRMTAFRGKGWAVKYTRAVFMDGSHLCDLVCRAPRLGQKLVHEMVDRSREATKHDERAGKMLALGKLSAGLAHELNNPASAVVRSASRLRDLLTERRMHAVAMHSEVISEGAAALMLELDGRIARFAGNSNLMDGIDALEQADREAELADWLESRGFPLDTASPLTASGVDIHAIQEISKLMGHGAFVHGLRILAADCEILSLSREIEEASKRIAGLVQAVKSYSYMDRVQVGEVDIEQGIETTLRMFQYQLKHGVRVVREFAGDLPKIKANGGELNQVWTNLIDNAIDAMSGVEDKVLGVRTCCEPAWVLVEVSDSGCGIPADVQPRIFDAFYTTKEVGKGTGLGLDIVHRIVRNHKGSIRVHSTPGKTVFQVRLPRP